MPALHKIEIHDPLAEQQLAARGARLIADYGGYRLYESASTPPSGEVRDDYNHILLNAATLDTSRAKPAGPQKSAAAFAGKRLRLVHFAGPPLPAWRQSLIDSGTRIVDYVPENAYLIYGDAAALGALQQFAAAAPQVQWEGDYLPGYKIHPAAQTANSNRFAIQLVADNPANAETLKSLDRLKLAPLERNAASLQYVNVVGRFAQADLAEIASRPDVISIQPYGQPHKVCERQDQIVAGAVSNGNLNGPGYLSWLSSKGFTQQQFDSSAFLVDVSDSGIDNGTTAVSHFGLRRLGVTAAASRVIYNRLFGYGNHNSTLAGCDGHGNLNAHIVAGYDDGYGFPFADPSGYHYGLGVCPFVRLGSSVIFDPINFTSPNYGNLLSAAYANGARVSNNSWGGSSDSSYDVDAQSYDGLVRDSQAGVAGNQEMVIVFAAGNDGLNTNTEAASLGTINSPGSAKNVITVGAAEGVQPFNSNDSPDGSGVYDNQADNANGVVDFSSRGPCSDGRHKPDLVAPGTHISGGVPQAASPGPDGTVLQCFKRYNTLTSQVGGVSGGPMNSPDFPYYPAGQQFYTASSGTSHSTPCVSGGCALLRQYFINHGLQAPSPAMTKAFLMNSARYLNGPEANDTLWSDSQGMGELCLGTAFDGVSRQLRDEASSDTFTASGQNHVFSGVVSDASKPFRVTVAWTDAPGSTTSPKALVNDINLTVSIGGKTYKGNVFAGAFSTAGGSPDALNNVESVFLPPGLGGVYTVNVQGYKINAPGVPNAGGLPMQDFALVVYNAKASVAPAIVAAGSAILSESCVAANDAVDPGERVTVGFGLQNVGASDATNLVVTLLPTNGVLAPSASQNLGALRAGAAPTQAAFSFYVDAACGSTINALLGLQVGGATLGTVAFALPVGATLAQTPVSQTFSAGIPNGWGDSTDGSAAWSVASGAAYAPDVPDFNDAFLTTPPISLVGKSTQLIFQHSYNLESPGGAAAYDGGVLEIKVGGADFVDILAAGASFASNGYNSTIIAESDSPYANRRVWSGKSGGYRTTVVNLPDSLMGQTVQFQWVCATDDTNDPTLLKGSSGWWIRSVQLTDQQPVCCQSPQPSAAAILAPVDGARTASPVIEVSGMAPDSSVNVLDNGASVAALGVDANGFFDGYVALSYGPNLLVAQAGPDSPSVAVTLVPPAPALHAPAASINPVSLSGQAVPGAAISIFDNGAASPVAATTADSTGNFSVGLTLPPATHSLSASATVDGVVGALSPPALVNVLVIPSPVVTFPTNGYVTNNPALTLRGSAKPGATVTIYDNARQLGRASVNSTGGFTFAASALSSGLHQFTAAQSVSGVMGNPGAPISVTVQLTPVFRSQPKGQTSFLGGAATFSGAAYGAPPLQYWWQRNGVNVPGAVSAKLALYPLTFASAGNYRLYARNAYGSASSQPASLAVVSNPFPPLAGAYNGLYMESPARFDSSGLLTLNLTALGQFTGKIIGGGASFNFTGGFPWNGHGAAVISRGAGVPPLTLTLNLDLTGGLPQILGSVSDGDWTAPLQADLDVFSPAHPFNRQGSYTALFGDGGANGYASVTTGPKGCVAFAGSLPDNTPLAPAMPTVSTNGLWPLYVSLYNNAGALFGWIQFTNDSNAAFAGDLLWVRTNHFTNALALTGSRLVARSPFLGLTNLQLTLAGGDLTGPLTGGVTLLMNGSFLPRDAAIPGLALAVNLTNGLIAGHFSNATTRLVEQIKGAVFQAQTNAAGFFYDAKGAGTFLLEPHSAPH